MCAKLKWRDEFSEEVLNQSVEYVDFIENVVVRDNHIDANLKKSAYFHVSIDLNNDKITNMYCTCSKKGNCKHEAAVLAYVEENELLEKEKEFLTLIESVDENILREYIADVFRKYPLLKENFIRKFKKEPKIDSTPYFDELQKIIDKSKGSHYSSLGYYDIEVLAEGIYDFLCGEIYTLMDIHQYELVFELLDQIGDVLSDEMYVDDYRWYDACDEYLQIVYKLKEVYFLSDTQLNKLGEKTSFMRSYM